jgi:hypothetical protein
MDSLLIDSTPSWLITATTALGPLIALLIGFVTADRWLRWLFGREAPLHGRERRNGCKVIP